MDTLMNSFGDANSIQMMGVVNALKTGNSAVDAMLAMAVPYVLSKGAQNAYRKGQHVLGALQGWFLKDTPNPEAGFCYKRSMSFAFEQRRSGSGTTTQACDATTPGRPKQRNEDLLRAMQLYVYKNCPQSLQDNATIELAEGEKKQTAASQHNNRPGTQAYQALERCEVVETMPNNVWHNVGEFGCPKLEIEPHPVKMIVTTNTDTSTDDSGDENTPRTTITKTTTTVNLVSTGPEAIAIFIDTVFKWYLAQLEEKTQEYRYMYDTDGSVYRLADDKTFESLFSKDCRTLSKIVDHFYHKTGKYAIQGYPNKLGLMLYGPPGTGKTSLIKALAHKTGRSVVTLNLSSIHTNRQLKDAFFKTKYVNDLGQTIHLDFQDKIFVMEDLDADSDVVKDRSLQTKPKARKRTKKGRSQMLNDKLNLTGLLNVLDGIVDTPGRMLVITTNHPELLDPALIRPGRIDKIIHMGYMAPEDVQLMIEHYFQGKLTQEEAQELERVMDLPGARFTPAVVEQITIENDDIVSMIAALKTKAQQNLSSNDDEEEEEEAAEDDEGGTTTRKRSRTRRA